MRPTRRQCFRFGKTAQSVEWGFGAALALQVLFDKLLPSAKLNGIAKALGEMEAKPKENKSKLNDLLVDTRSQ